MNFDLSPPSSSASTLARQVINLLECAARPDEWSLTEMVVALGGNPHARSTLSPENFNLYLICLLVQKTL